MRVLFVIVMFLFFNVLVSFDNNNNHSRPKLTEEGRTKSCNNFPQEFRKKTLAETQKSNSFGPSTVVGMQKISEGTLGSVSKESLGTNSPRQSPRSRKANSDESDSRGSSSPKSMLQKQSENPERFEQSPPAPPKPRRAQTSQILPSSNLNNK